MDFVFSSSHKNKSITNITRLGHITCILLFGQFFVDKIDRQIKYKDQQAFPQIAFCKICLKPPTYPDKEK